MQCRCRCPKCGETIRNLSNAAALADGSHEGCCETAHEEALYEMPENEQEVALFAERMLNTLGIQPTLRGRRYLAYAIVLCITDTSLLELLTKDLYPRVGRQFQTNAKCVERSMRHAIQQVWVTRPAATEHWKQVFNQFNFFVADKPPTIKDLLTMLVMIYPEETGMETARLI